MMKFKQIVVSAVLGTALVVGSSSYALAEDAEPVHQHEHGVRHGEHGKHHQLTEEQKAALQQAGVDIKKLKETELQLRDTVKSIHQQGKELKEVAKDNQDLKQQIRSDLQPVKENFKQVRELRKTNHALRQELKAAVDAKDTAKIKATYEKLVANQQQALQLLQEIDVKMKAEVQKVKG